MHTWSGLACLHRQVPWLAEESHGSHHFSLPPPCSLASWDGRVRQGWALVCLTLGVSFPSPPFCPPHCHQDSPPSPGRLLSLALQLGPVHVVPGRLGEPSVFGVHLFPVHVALHHGSLPFHIPCLFLSPPAPVPSHPRPFTACLTQPSFPPNSLQSPLSLSQEPRGSEVCLLTWP